ncbi:MAG: 50S ribosomal protein L6 [Thermoplasmata archaeon]|nr:MAG: 50S ribosomal protein L6 [Thermoplasmata archaeon]
MPVAGEINTEVKLPQGVSAEYKANLLTIKGTKGELKRIFKHPRLNLNLKGNTIKLSCRLPNRRENALFGTWQSHIQNMIKGVTEGFSYRMKIVYSHFPIKVSVREGTFVIENFLGERHPRQAKIVGETKVKVSGDQVILTGHNIEHVGQSAANIEQATKIKNYDPRVFQDGIYLVGKGSGSDA